MVSSAPPPQSSSAEFANREFSLLNTLVDSLNGLRNRSARLQFQANAQSKFQTLEHNKGEFLENFHQNIYQISELIKCRKD